MRTRHGADEYWNNPYIQDHTAGAARMLAESTFNGFQEEIGQRMMSCWGEGATGVVGGRLEFDSPLEAAFWIWWMAVRQGDYFSRLKLVFERHVEVIVGDDRYVLDFVLGLDNPSSQNHPTRFLTSGWPKIGVELDGHAFHEKTLEQVNYRNRRDRELQQAGWHIFHFSFSEFTQNAENCIWEVVDYARQIYHVAAVDDAIRRP